MLGALMTLLVTAQSESTLDEWYSAQALYAAQSATQIAAYQINQSAIAGGGTSNCAVATTGILQLESGLDSWYSINSTLDTATYAPINVCKIIATGYAGNDPANPIAQRELTVIYNTTTL